MNAVDKPQALQAEVIHSVLAEALDAVVAEVTPALLRHEDYPELQPIIVRAMTEAFNTLPPQLLLELALQRKRQQIARAGYALL